MDTKNNNPDTKNVIAHIPRDNLIERCTNLEDLILKQEHLVMMGKLCAGIAHELKNPLGLATNFSEVSINLVEELAQIVPKLKNENNNQEINESIDIIETLVENLTRIKDNTQRASKIIKSILGSVRNETKSFQPLDLNNIIELNVKLAYQGLRSKNKEFNVSIQKNLAPDLGVILGNEDEIGRAILNIADNAFDIMNELSLENPDYKPVLNLESQNLDDMIKITIKDNGCGIKPENIKKIFEPFYTTKHQGSGIGLALTWSIIVNNHNGRIDVESKPNEGTSFHIYLPYVKKNNRRD